MAYRLTDEERAFAESARRLLAKRADTESVRQIMETEVGYDAALWQTLCAEQGWAALDIPEAYDGFEFGLTAHAALMEQAGYALFCGPLLSTSLAANVLTAADDSVACETWLPKLAAGATMGVALGGPAGGWSADDVAIRAAQSDDGWTLSGVADRVIDGHIAEAFLVFAKTDDGVALFVIDAAANGVVTTLKASMDQTRRKTQVQLHGVALSGDALVVADATRALRLGVASAAVSLAAEQVGGAQRCLDDAVEYANVREQFGRPIGSFQAIKHKCADMMTRVESARSAAYAAAAAGAKRGDAAGDAAFIEAAACAAAYCAEAYFFCASESIQIHGGVGFTWEYDAHMHFKRATAGKALFGSPQAWRERLATTYVGATASDAAGLELSDDERAFRDQARAFLSEKLDGEWAHVRFRGGPGDEHALVEERKAWGRMLGQAGWSCIDWAKEHGGRGASIMQQVVFNEEYARLGGPGRIGHIGETLAGPTIAHFGNDDQRARFLDPIRLGEAIWCQGYSEPNAGSDLANVQTKAERVGDEYIITGQKTWTSHAHIADWCFALCRTDHGVAKHKGISYILVPMDQPGVEVRPIRQMTGTSEFGEVFFDGAKASVHDVIGGENNGWKVAMGTLAFERGASTLGQQLAFQNEFDAIVRVARENGAMKDPVMRQRIADAHVGLQIMRWTALRVLSSALADGELPRAAMINKLYWANWHRDLGELAMDVLGDAADDAETLPYELTALQRMYLFSRSDTIYAGSNQIQRNIISERALGMPRHK